MMRKLLATCLLITGLGLPSLSSADRNPERDVFFGEQHVHTSWSFDAFAFGTTKTGPEEFYRYSTGQPTVHPGGYTVQITKPLDWALYRYLARRLSALTEDG